MPRFSFARIAAAGAVLMATTVEGASSLRGSRRQQQLSSVGDTEAFVARGVDVSESAGEAEQQLPICGGVGSEEVGGKCRTAAENGVDLEFGQRGVSKASLAPVAEAEPVALLEMDASEGPAPWFGREATEERVSVSDSEMAAQEPARWAVTEAAEVAEAEDAPAPYAEREGF